MLPLIGDRRVYVHDQESLVALEEAGGQRMWAARATGNAMAISDRYVVAHSRQEARFDVLDPATGEIVQRIGTGGLNAVVHERSLIAENYQIDTASLYCVSLESREVLWTVRLAPAHDPGPPPRFFSGVFGVAADRVIVGRDDGTVVAYGLADGRLLWGMNVTAVNAATSEKMGEVRGAVVIWQDRALLEIWPWGACALAVESGEVIWRWDGCVPLEAYLYDGRYYVLSQEGRLFVLDATSGKQLKETDLRAGLPKAAQKDTAGRIIEPLLASETHVWVGSDKGAIVAFDRETLKYAWHGKPKKAASTHFKGNYFVSVNGRLYWGDQTCGIHCFEEERPTDPVLRAIKERPKSDREKKTSAREAKVKRRK